MLLNRDVFLKDPTSWTIPNDGVAKVGVPETPQQWAVLEHELRSFVCEGEYARGLERILSSYLTHLGQASQPAVWVSGFYGSGKSHLVRVLEALWRDIEFPNGERARNMVSLPAEIRNHLVELSTAGRRHGGLWSAAGTLSAAGDVSVRLATLSVVFRAAGLPAQYHQARLVLYLKQNNLYDAVVSDLERAGTSLDLELEDMFVSIPLAEAILRASPGFASDAAGVRELLRAQYARVTDITDDEFVSVLRSVLRLVSDTPDKIPCTLIVLDELQQFLGDNPSLILDLQNVVERCVSSFGSTLLFVGTGQSQLIASPQLQKLLGRFTVRVQLEDRDIEHVIREVVLRKDETKRPVLEAVLDDARAEIDRHLQGTHIGPRSDDQAVLVADYPLLPTRRRFWERVLRAVDSAGLAGQLRTQLRIVHDATREVAREPVGTVIPADRIYQHLKSNMLNSSLLLREVSNRIDELDDGTEIGRLRSRLCATIFLIEQLPKEGIAQTGVRPTADVLADLLVEDLRAGSTELRQRIPEVLKELVDDGTLHRVGDEYHVQTAESREWQRDFNRRFASIRNNDVQMAGARDAAFREAIGTALKGVRLQQGVSKQPRTLDLHFGDDRPSPATGVPVWIPLSWPGTENQFVQEAVQAGTNSPVVFVYLPRGDVEAIRKALATIAAAEETIAARGAPSTDEARQAQAGMISHRDTARGELVALINDVLSNARVFQGGGNEVAEGASLVDNVRYAAERSLARLYPSFSMADHTGWSTVLRRAREGSTSALEAVDYKGSSESHPVTQEILNAVGSGKRGIDIRKQFEASPYGWPQDAIDGALVALVADGKLRATYDDRPVTAKDLTQTIIGRAFFHVEEIILTTTQKLELLGMARMILGRAMRTEELTEAIAEALDAMRALAQEAGGEPPRPERPSTAYIDELRGYGGNERLLRVWEQRERLKTDHTEWLDCKQKIERRWPRWERLVHLLEQSAGLPEADEIREQADAIRDNRSLIAEPDPVRPLSERLSQALRERLLELHEELEKERLRCIGELVRLPEWHRVSDETKDDILRKVQLLPLPKPDVGDDDKLIAALQRTPLTTLAAARDAIPERMDRARAELLRLVHQDKVISVKLPGATIKTPEDVERYVAQVRQTLLEQLGTDGKTTLVV